MILRLRLAFWDRILDVSLKRKFKKLSAVALHRTFELTRRTLKQRSRDMRKLATLQDRLGHK